MNSFNTHADTKRIEHKYNSRVDMHMFEQSCYPRILKETLRPYPDSMNADQSWCVVVWHVCSEGCGLECALRGMSGMCAQRGGVWSVR